jgi:hypothetical protein
MWLLAIAIWEPFGLHFSSTSSACPKPMAGGKLARVFTWVPVVTEVGEELRKLSQQKPEFEEVATTPGLCSLCWGEHWL